MAIPERSFQTEIIPRRLVDLRSPVQDRANMIVDLSVMSRHLGISISKKLARYGVNYNLWQVLVTLWGGHAVTPAAVAQHLQVEPATISRYLDQLETSSYIARQRSKTDRRVVDIVITAKGEKVVRAGLKELDDVSKKLSSK